MGSKTLNPGDMILSPDHPFLAKYQSALTEFLQASLSRVDVELKNLKTSVKAKESEYFQDLGVKLYEAKKTFDQRRDKLADVTSKVTNAAEARKLKSGAVVALRDEVARASSVIVENRKLNEHLIDEAARLASDERILSALRRDVDLQMDVLRNAVQKTEKDLESNEELKQRQDLFVDRLIQESTKVEREKAGLLVKLAEISVRVGELQEEGEKVLKAVEEAKKDVGVAEKGWRSAVASAGARQDSYSKLMDELTRIRNETTATQTAIQATRRLVFKEIEEHERLAGMKSETETRNSKLTAELGLILNELAELKSEAVEKLNYSTELRKTVDDEAQHGANLTSKRDSVVASLVKLKSKKEVVEKAVLGNLKASEAGKAHAKHLSRLKSELKDAVRGLELQAAELENGIAAADLAKAAAQAEIGNLHSAIVGLNEELRKKTENLSRTLKELKAQETLLAKKHAKVDSLGKKLAGLTGAIDLHKDLEEGEALRRAISCLKEGIKEAQAEAKTLNRTWLKFQHELLEVASKQSKMEKEAELTADKIALLEEKSGRLAVRIDSERQDVTNTRKVIRDLRNAVTQLTHEITSHEEARELFGREVALKQAEAKARRKDFDVALSEKRREIQDTLEAIAELNRDIAEAEAISAAWDRKYQLCKDYKDVAAQEDQQNGEMALKKAELNRLAHEGELIRQRQQELAQRLEECVHRRQNLCEQAVARQGQPPPKSVSAVARRKVKEVAAAAVEVKRKAKTTDEQVKALKGKCAKLEQEAAVARMEADSSENAVRALKNEVTSKQFEVYVNKEQLAISHDVIKWMEAAKKGKYAYVVKTGAKERRAEVLGEQEDQRRALTRVLDTLGAKHDEEMVAETRAVLATL